MKVVATSYALAFALAISCGCSAEPPGGVITIDAANQDGVSADGTATDASATDTAATDASATDTAATDTAATDTAATDAADTDAGGGGQATFAEVYKQVIVGEGCGSAYCHGTVWADPAKAYSHLLKAQTNVPKCGSKRLVVPNDPAASLFWLKMDPSAQHGCGAKMPPPGKGVSLGLSKLVKDWILAGALQ
jgi:hypothetical protein